MCLLFGYVEDLMVNQFFLDWGGEDVVIGIQDKVFRMCIYFVSGGSNSDSDLDYGDNGFGVGRGQLVKVLKSVVLEIEII